MGISTRTPYCSTVCLCLNLQLTHAHSHHAYVGEARASETPGGAVEGCRYYIIFYSWFNGANEPMGPHSAPS